MLCYVMLYCIVLYINQEKYRMIRNLEKIDYVQSFKITIMHSISRILKSQPSNSILFAILRIFLTIIASCSVLFINSPLEPKLTNQIFNIFVLTHVTDLLTSNSHIFIISLLVFQTLVSILIIINFLNTPISYAVKALCFLMPLMRALIVPFFYFLLQNLGKLLSSQKMDTSFFILRLILIVLSTFTIVFTCFYTYFFIRPLRFQNIQWNYSNNQSFIHMIFTLVRAFSIYVQLENILMLFLSLIAEIQICRMQKCWLCPQSQLLQKSKHILCILINLSVLLGAIFSNKSLSFVLLIMSFVIYITFLGINFMAIRHSIEEIPLCKKQNCSLFYAFFIEFKSRNRNVGEDLAKKVNFHLLVCNNQQCIFKDGAQFSTYKINAEEMEQKISRFLKQFRYDSPESELMYEIWKIQMNRTISLSHKLRPFSLEHQYVVQFILGIQSSNKAQNSLSSSILPSSHSSSPAQQNNSLSSKWNFYKQLNISVNQFEKMSEILSKPLPQLNQIIDTVIGIDKQTFVLTQIFQEMIRNKEANYVCIELYLKYFDVFFNQNKLSSDIIEKLKRLKILVDSDFIEENPLPSFIIDSSSTAIEKVNAQALKFLRIHRFELKDKQFSNFIIPKFDPKQVYQYQQKSQKEQNFPIFFKIKSNQKTRMYCRQITLKPLQLNNKNYFEITVEKKNNSHNFIQFLIDQQQNILATTSNKIMLVFQEGKIQFDLVDVYCHKIKPILKEISFEKIGRIDFQEFCLMSGLVSQKRYPYDSKMRLFSINFVKKMINTISTRRTSQARLSRLFNLHSQFNFHYKLNPDQLQVTLQGTLNSSGDDDQILDDNLSMRTLNEKLTNYIVEVAGNRQINYSAGIKVYRLYQGDLYNIDLEDKGKYQELFNNVQFNLRSSKNCDFKINSKILVALLIGLATVVIGCCLFLSIVVGNELNYVESQQIKLLHIEEFSLNYNRIMASLRDKATQLYDTLGGDFTINVLDSYAELQKYDSSNFLSQTVQQGIYSDEVYQGSLSELIEVSLTHVYQYMQLRDDAIIQYIHDFSLKYLGPLLSAQKQQKKLAIQSSFKSLLKYSLICLIFIIGCSLGYFIFFMLVSREYKKRLNNFIEPLLLLSEHENKRISEECEKFKNTISSLYKNYQIDLDSLGQKNQGSKKRERPKRTNFGICSLFTQFIVGGLTVVVIIGIVSLQYSTINLQTSTIKKFFKQSEAVMESYSGLNWATNQFEHLAIVNLPQIYNLSLHLDTIQFNRDGYQFSPELTQVVKMVFFEDSCAYLVGKNIIDQKWCGDFMKSFLIANPLKLGLSLYFRRMYYNLISDLGQTYGSNGIYSEPFKQIFQYFSQKIRKQTQQKMISIKSTLIALATIASILSFWLIAIFVISYAYFKNKIKNVSKGLISLIGEQNTGREKEIQNDKGGIEEAEWSIGEKIEEEDFLIPAKEGLDQICQQ